MPDNMRQSGNVAFIMSWKSSRTYRFAAVRLYILKWGDSVARNIHSNYYEDNYCKHECRDCRRCFIVGEVLSEGMKLACPYCGSSGIEMIVVSADDTLADMDMGCLGLYFSRYEDGALMLHTESEFADAMRRAAENSGGSGIPLVTVYEHITNYCAQRDCRGAPHG